MVSEVLRKSLSAGKRLFGKKNGISMGYGDLPKIVEGVQQIYGTMPLIEQKRTILLYLQTVNPWTTAQSFQTILAPDVFSFICARLGAYGRGHQYFACHHNAAL